MSEVEATPDNQPPVQPDLPGTVDPMKEKLKAANARADAAEAVIKEGKNAQNKKKKEAEANAAIAEGRATEALKEKTERLDSLQSAFKTRIDKNFEKLSTEGKAEVEAIREHLPLEALEAFIDARLATSTVKPGATDEANPSPEAVGATQSTTAPPAPGPQGGGMKRHKGHEITPETRTIMEHNYADPQTFELTKELGVDSRGRFGWGHCDDEFKSTSNFIHLMKKLAFEPQGQEHKRDPYGKVLSKR